MSSQVQEITNFSTGIDLSLDPILAPADAFVNLRNGFVHRGVLQSRPGFYQFADGNDSTDRIVSRVSNGVTSEAASTGDGTSIRAFTLANPEVERGIVTVNAPVEGLTITFTYAPVTGLTTITGDFGTGTNDINYQTGAMNVSFGDGVGGNTVIGVGNAINVTYSYHPNLAIMGIHEYVQTTGTKELIVCDEDFPYVYDGTDNDFDRIAFVAPTTAFTGGTDNFFTFENWRLNSKGAVPAAAGALTLSDVLFMTNNTDAPFVYDGTSVDLVSNMPEFRAPAEGALNKALHVLSYGERLCWLRPTLGTNEFAQAILWGPINDTGGLALDYQGSGSGILSAVTNSKITGYKFLRDTLIVFFETDVYALELTDDNFQPFKWTKLEDERGSEATHAAVGFLGDVESPGRLGILGTNGRRTVRVDNKIPNFTRDRFDGDLLTHVFGEEMEEDSQFWWSFPDTESVDITTSNKVLVKNFEEENYSIYDIKLSVLNKTILGQGTVWDNLPDTFDLAEVIWNKWGFLSNRYKTIFGDHNGFIFAMGESFADGKSRISATTSGGTAITLGATTTVQTEFHHFQVGDQVIFRDITGTVELNDLIGTITSVPTRSSFVVNIDSTNFTAWTSGGEAVKLINFEAEFVPFNPLRAQSRTCYLGKMDLLVKSATGDYTIDFYENRDPDTWTEPDKSFTFSSSDVVGIDRWFSIYVDNVADFHRWKISQNKINEQTSIKSIRVHYKDGGDSNV